MCFFGLIWTKIASGCYEFKLELIQNIRPNFMIFPTALPNKVYLDINVNNLSKAVSYLYCMYFKIFCLYKLQSASDTVFLFYTTVSYELATLISNN